MHVVSARFFTSPQLSPSGVSLGHNIAQCDPCKALGPLIFLVFSNYEVILVIIPRQPIKVSLYNTYVTPALSILKRFKFQFPVEIAAFIPLVMISPLLMKVVISK